MTKTLTKDRQTAKQKSETPATILTRRYEAEEFEADTTEERPVPLLAERRRQFLAELKARQTDADTSTDKSTLPTD